MCDLRFEHFYEDLEAPLENHEVELLFLQELRDLCFDLVRVLSDDIADALLSGSVPDVSLLVEHSFQDSEEPGVALQGFGIFEEGVCVAQENGLCHEIAEEQL